MSIGGGSSRQSSSSSNRAFDFLQNTFGGQAQQGAQSGNFISQLLGMQGGDEAQNAFARFRDSTGYQAQLQGGQNAINSNNAASGLLNSGAAVKASQKFGANLGANYFQQFLQNLVGQQNAGLQAGGLLAGAGNVSNSSGKSSNFNFGF